MVPRENIGNREGSIIARGLYEHFPENKTPGCCRFIIDPSGFPFTSKKVIENHEDSTLSLGTERV